MWIWKCAEEGFRTKPLIEYLRTLPDPRCGRKSRHDHGEVLLCLILGFLAGRLTIRRSLKWCRKRLEWLRGYVPLRNGIASPSTACRILSGIDEELFACTFMEWIGEIINTRGLHLAVDGKALRAAVSKVSGSRTPMVMISDMELTAGEMGGIKRTHWAVENSLHHVLDDTFREDRSPARKSKNNLALIRKFVYNILRIAMLSKSCAGIMTEAMDDFCDDLHLIEKYVFNGISSFY